MGAVVPTADVLVTDILAVDVLVASILAVGILVVETFLSHICLAVFSFSIPNTRAIAANVPS